jgi:hypothetical protein
MRVTIVRFIEANNAIERLVRLKLLGWPAVGKHVIAD